MAGDDFASSEDETVRITIPPLGSHRASWKGMRRTPFVILIASLIMTLLAQVALGAGAFAFHWGPFAQGAHAAATAATPYPTPTPLGVGGPNVVQRENLLAGSAGWTTPPARRASTQIQAYLSATSVRPGRVLTIYVSVLRDQTKYTIDIYRLGWYGGQGARLVLSAKQTGQAQGYYDQLRGRLFGCRTCRVDTALGLVEVNWKASYRLTIPDDWITGVYMAKFTDAQGMQTYATFDVTGSDYSTYVLVTADTTVAAYNEWGGYSLYLWRFGSGGHARKVSLDRPVSGWGDEQGLMYEINGIRWAERQGYDISYLSSTDLHEAPDQLLRHKAYLTFGHDEYWSREMREGVQRARDAGVGLGFFGANIGYWQIRFEPDSRGARDRTIICYKEANMDPLFGSDNSRVTTKWREAPVNEPENALVGVMYESYAVQPNGFPWVMNAGVNSDLLAGTNLAPGARYGCDIVGYEWDRTFANRRTPTDLKVIGSSPAVDHTGIPGLAQTVYYVAPSGALVFAAGTVDWTFALDDYRLFANPRCLGRTQAIPGLQRLTSNVMAALVVHDPH
jgi:N,N-dimethylformamidase beta subunit-like, C-terminal